MKANIKIFACLLMILPFTAKAQMATNDALLNAQVAKKFAADQVSAAQQAEEAAEQTFALFKQLGMAEEKLEKAEKIAAKAGNLISSANVCYQITNNIYDSINMLNAYASYLQRLYQKGDIDLESYTLGLRQVSGGLRTVKDIEDYVSLLIAQGKLTGNEFLTLVELVKIKDKTQSRRDSLANAILAAAKANIREGSLRQPALLYLGDTETNKNAVFKLDTANIRASFREAAEEQNRRKAADIEAIRTRIAKKENVENLFFLVRGIIGILICLYAAVTGYRLGKGEKRHQDVFLKLLVGGIAMLAATYILEKILF